MRILLFILLGSLPPSDGAPLVGNVCWQTTKSILILRGTDRPQVLQGTSSGTVPSQASCPGHKHSPVSSGRDHTCSTRTTWRGCSRVAAARLLWTEVACCWPRCCWCHPAPWTPSHHCIQQHESFSVWKRWGQNNLAYVCAKLHAEEDYHLLNHTTWEPQPSSQQPGHHLKLLEPYRITQQSGQQENLHHLLLPLSPCSLLLLYPVPGCYMRWIAPGPGTPQQTPAAMQRMACTHSLFFKTRLKCLLLPSRWFFSQAGQNYYLLSVLNSH